MNERIDVPQLPEEIVLDSVADGSRGQTDDLPPRLEPIRPPIPWPPFVLRTLRQGAYFLQWRPKSSLFRRYNGTLRVERHGGGVTASGDLYSHHAFRIVTSPTFQLVPNPDPSLSAGIPIFPRSRYSSYLRITQILEHFTFADSFELKFEKFDFDSTTNSWTNAGLHSAVMHFAAAPPNYPSGATFLQGMLKGPAGTDLGTISMGWVSKYLRKATLEIDRVRQSEYPGDNGAGLDWKGVFEAVDWDLDAYESDTNLPEPSGQSWSDAEMHAAMLARRDSADLDAEWRYHVLAVRRLDSTSRGIMYDAFSGDSNNIPREGAGISSHWTIPDVFGTWGSVKGMRFGEADAPYFRTAVHELGHALGLYHNTADNGFMNTTGTIASSPGIFPANIQWSFNAADAKRLRHMPDPWVRPGMIPFGSSYTSAPISPTDALDIGGPLELRVEPLLEAVPIGAPVRVKLTLGNVSDAPIAVPDSLSLKSEYVTGTVVDPSRARRGYRSIMKCVEDHERKVLKPGQTMSQDMTLLRGMEGALFPAPGLHRIEVDVAWDMVGVDVRIAGATNVMITPPVDQHHAAAAAKTLSEPDLLLTLAIGGDHLEEGNAALEAAMQDDTLAPHYAVIKAKQVGRRFGKRKADPEAAIKVLGTNPVVSASEASRVAEIADEASEAQLKKAPEALAATLKDAANGNKKVARVVDNMLA